MLVELGMFLNFYFLIKIADCSVLNEGPYVYARCHVPKGPAG